MESQKKAHTILRFVCLFCIVVFGLATITGTSGDEIEDEETQTAPATTDPNTGPTAAITSPVDATVYNEGNVITFTGTGTDTEDGTIVGKDLEWNSSVDGFIGFGSVKNNVFLSKGTHEIILTATDSTGATSSAIINLTVNPHGNTIPTTEITNPVDAAGFSIGDLITFSGTGTDTEDGDLSDQYLTWISNIDGQIGTGKSFSTNTLSSGNHTIVLSAQDSDNTIGTASISISIGNTPPTATINYPAADAELFEGESIIFSGTGSDPEDGTLDENSLIWMSNKDGSIGTGISPTVTSLSSGVHVLTLIVTDSAGATGIATITITIINTTPTATITNPSDGDSFNTGDNIIFSGTGTDEEDGNLYGASLVWTSSISGHLGAGTAITVSTLSIGTHLMTLTVTDKNSATDTDTIIITVQ